MREPLDVLDELGQVVEVLPREEVHRRRLLHRCVHVFVFDPRQRLWLQRRALDRRLWPGLWTSSVSGHVDAGETEEAAVVREAREELGLELEVLPRRVAQFRYRDEHEHELAGLWETSTGRVPRAGPEVMEVRAVPRAELERWRTERRHDFAPSFLAALEAYGWA